MLNINSSKSYATKENLAKGLAKLGLADVTHVVVCNDEGRFTAIFPVSFMKDSGHSLFYPAHKGFMVLG